MCLSFWYYAVGVTDTSVLIVSLKDLTKGNVVFLNTKLNATMFGQWNHFTLSLTKLPIRFAISISTSYQARNLQSDIALDEIRLTSSGCSRGPFTPPPTTPVPYVERKWDCNFEYNCGFWKFDSNYWMTTSYRKGKK